MLRQYLKSLADKFREVCPSLEGDTISAKDFPDAIEYVYDEAYHKGSLSGGGSSDDSKFWDMLTDYGTKEQCAYAFYYWRLVDSDGKVLFKPEYDIKPTTANSMFEQTKGAIDLNYVFTEAGKELNFSKCTAMNRLFFRSEVAKLGTIDCTSTSTLASTFGDCSNLTEIVEIKFSDKEYTFTTPFLRCTALTNMKATGSLSSSGLDLSDCPLTKASKLSFLNILVDTNTAKTITFGAGEKLTKEDVAEATQKGWTVLYD
jgi:hypothetical protein